MPDSKPVVLLLAHSWPPDANVGAVRPVYLSRQLGRLGWQPVVVTVREEFYEWRNDKGIAGAESAWVIRTGTLKNPRFAYLWLKRLLKKNFGADRAVVSRSPSPAGPVGVPSQVKKPELKENFLSLLSTPDEYLGWFPFALIATWKAVSKYRPVCIITTGPPHTSHLVALVLKRLRQVPWIIDQRDPWSWHDLPASHPRRWRDAVNARLESLVISGADRVVCVSHGVTSGYRERFRSVSEGKWYTITNGFDFDEFEALGEVAQAERFTISHVGTLDFERTPQLLLQAIAELIKRGEIDRSRVAVRLIGCGQFANGMSLVDLIGELGLAGVAQIVPPVPRPEALREMIRSHVLLLIAGTQRLSIAAKLFEYLASGRPILVIAEDWAAADIVRKLDAGKVVAPYDLDSAMEAVRSWYGQYLARERCPQGRRESLAPETLEYSWESLGKRYGQLIEQLVVEHATSR